jgi:DNA-binding response OmpR family regulator
VKQQSTILIVDDEPISRENLADVLVTQGYELIFASNGPECLQKVVEFTPDVILLDVMMPEMDGFEVCRRVRAEAASAEVPIIMVTALDDRESRLQGIEAGADDFISKPIDRVELRARLRTITRLNRYRRLISQRARFQWVVDQADQAYLILTETDEIRYANVQARRYLGLPQDDHEPIIGKFRELTLKYYQCRPRESWRTWPDLPPADYDRRRFLIRPETATTDMQWLQVDVMEMTPEQEAAYLVRLEDARAHYRRQAGGGRATHGARRPHRPVYHPVSAPAGPGGAAGRR